MFRSSSSRPRAKSKRKSSKVSPALAKWLALIGTVFIALMSYAAPELTEHVKTELLRQSPSAQSPQSAPSRGGQLIDAVTRVRDGDTIVVGLVPIRLANLNCAETGTIEGEAASLRMKAMVQGQELRCQLEGRRSWDREVGVCALSDGRDIGEIMIAEGICKRWK